MMSYLFIALFFAAMLGISYVSSKKVKSLDDFHLGGRSVGPWLSAMAYGATYFSAVIFVGYAGKLGWGFGLGAVWIGIGNAVIGTWLAWKVMAEPTREMTRRLNVQTMPELFEKRFGCKWMKVFAAAVIFIFLTPYCASVYQGLGMMVESALNIPYAWACIALAVITGIYLIAGGYLADAMTAVVQAAFMLIGVMLIGFFFFKQTGGVGQAVADLAAADPARAQVFGKDPLNLFWLVMLTSLGVWGLPQMAHKFYAIESGQAIKKGTIISTLWSLVVGGAAYLFGSFSFSVLNGEMPAGGVDAIIPTIMTRMMPPVMLGLIVVMLLAASMSTLASLVLASASSISIDLVKGVLKPGMSDKDTTRWMRVLCGVFMLISVVIALVKVDVIVNLMSFSWGAVAGVCIGPYVFGVLWKRTTKWGAWAGMIGALMTTIVMSMMPQFAGQSPMIGVLSMFASLILTPAVSLLTKAE
jgi:SSS family transporter